MRIKISIHLCVFCVFNSRWIIGWILSGFSLNVDFYQSDNSYWFSGTPKMLLQKLLQPAAFLQHTAQRYNCPWHRNNWRPCYFPFRMKKRVTTGSVDGRMETPGGRQIMMRRILRESGFIGWRHDVRTPEKRLSYPL